MTLAAKVPLSEAQRAMLPPDGRGEAKPAGTETIVVAGKPFAADVYKFEGTVKGLPATGTLWRSAAVPGGVVKTQWSGGITSVKMIVKRVTAK